MRTRAAAVMAFVVVGVLLACGGGLGPRPVVKAELADLIKENRSNPVAVRQKYEGKAVEVRGFVRQITRNIHRQTYVMISPSLKGSDEIQVYFLDESLVSRLAKYPVGSQITVRITIDDADQSLRAVASKVVD